jgi:hypothetical protein
MMKRLLLVFMMMFLMATTARAEADGDSDYGGPTQWDSFRHYMKERQEDDRIRGMSYMISGAIATVGGIAGYYNADDSFNRGVYAIVQSVGVAAIGYGANSYWNGNEYNSFFYAVEGAHLTGAQKAELLQRFLEKEKEQRRRSRWINVATHSLIAVANLYSASHEQDRNVRGVLNFLAGTNAIIAFSYAF